MSIETENDRFKRHGQGIAYYLWQLVSGDMNARTTAADILSEMRDGAGDRNSWNLIEAWTEFGVAIRQALADPAFKAESYIRHLTAQLRRTRMKRVDQLTKERERSNRLMDRLMDQLTTPGLTEQRQLVLNRRMTRVAGVGQISRKARRSISGMLGAQELAAMLVFQELHEYLLRVPDLVRELLRERYDAHLVLDVLKKLGPRAAMFADDLLQSLQADRVGFRPSVLASMIQDDPDRIRRVASLLDSEDPKVAANAAGTLYYLGERARQAVPRPVDQLMLLIGPQSLIRSAAIEAIGRVTHGTSIGVDSLLQLTHDPEMWMRGVAITALGDVGCEPGKVVPRLVECFSDYEEQDPDLSYESRHTRVTDALANFGPAAVPAIPALLGYLESEEGIDRGVLKALGAIGPTATEALPVLERLAAKKGINLECTDDALAVAIRRIREIGVVIGPSTKNDRPPTPSPSGRGLG